MRLRPLLIAVTLILTLAAASAGAACQTQRTVRIEADGQARLVTVYRAETVGDALAEAGVSLGPKDRVAPDVYGRLSRSGTISVVRVTERTESETEAVPFPREVVRDEALSRGVTRLLQAGAAGEMERTFRVTLEDGVAVAREQTGERVSRPPVSEVLQVGTMGSLPSVPLTGTLAYLSGGNAWVIRGSSGDKRPATYNGDLDGRVFVLSADGRELAFTRRPAEGAGGLNALWALNTLVVGDAAQPQHQVDVLAAAWRGESLIFSTGQATQSPPGWKANNDLWLLPAAGRLRQSLPSPGAPGAYGWWGRELAASPDGTLLAFGAADRVGVLDLETGQVRLLASFATFRTKGDWVWTPAPTWSPDGLRIAVVVHGRPPGAGAAEDSQVFDLWVLPADGTVGRMVASNVGMWAFPTWSPSGEYLAYGVAQEPGKSATSRYDLRLLHVGDGETMQPLQRAGWAGMEAQRLAWSPDGTELAAVHLGDLYVIDIASGQTRALTDDGRSNLPQWR